MGPAKYVMRHHKNKNKNKNKKNHIDTSKSEKILEKMRDGKSIPLINRDSFAKNTEQTAKTGTPSKNLANGTTSTKQLPEPKFSSSNETYSLPDMPSKPLHYIRYIEPSREEMDSRVDYNMDEEDMAWLESENEKRLQNGAPPVSMDDFEIIMDRFEKESYFELDRSENDEIIKDEEAICCICMDGESQPFNEILFCEMCNLAVHQECYGIPYIPEGQWLCRRCFNSPSAAVDCILCPSNTGALKMAEGGFWTHILCAIWVPEVQFANPVFLEPVESLGKIPPSRWRLTCQLCKMKGVGACIQCTQKKCNAAFHPTCAQKAGYYMKFIGRPGEPKTKDKHSVFCTNHRPKTDSVDKYENYRQKMLRSENSPITFHPVIPPECIQEIGERVEFKNKNVFIKKLLAFWLLKRKIRFGVPLLRTNVYELKKYKAESKDSPDGSNDKITTQEEFKKCLRFRQVMEKARLLLELVRKREKLKYELTKVKEKCLVLQLMPTVAFLKKLHQKLSKLDEKGVLEKFVAPDDLSVINLSKISNKIDSFEYVEFDDFEKDFNQMIEHFILSNDKNKNLYQIGTNIKNKSKSLMKKARIEFHNTIPSYEIVTSAIKEEDVYEFSDSEETADQVIQPMQKLTKTVRKKPVKRKRGSAKKTAERRHGSKNSDEDYESHEGNTSKRIRRTTE